MGFRFTFEVRSSVHDGFDGYRTSDWSVGIADITWGPRLLWVKEWS